MGAKDLLASIRGKAEDQAIETKRKSVEEKANRETQKVKHEISVSFLLILLLKNRIIISESLNFDQY